MYKVFAQILWHNKPTLHKGRNSFHQCTQFLNMSFGFIILSCKLLLRCDQPFSRKWLLKFLFLVIFPRFRNQNCHFRRSIRTAGCDIEYTYALQSYRSTTFCKRKTRVETECGYNLQLSTHSQIIIKSIPTRHCHLSSSLKHPFLAMAWIASGFNDCVIRNTFDVSRSLAGG